MRELALGHIEQKRGTNSPTLQVTQFQPMDAKGMQVGRNVWQGFASQFLKEFSLFELEQSKDSIMIFLPRSTIIIRYTNGFIVHEHVQARRTIFQPVNYSELTQHMSILIREEVVADCAFVQENPEDLLDHEVIFTERYASILGIKKNGAVRREHNNDCEVSLQKAC
jgi:hypothetical protein